MGEMSCTLLRGCNDVVNRWENDIIYGLVVDNSIAVAGSVAQRRK